MALGSNAYLKIRPKVSGMKSDAHDEDGKTAEDIEHRHDGNELLRDERDALDAAEEDEPCNDRDCNADHPCGYAECV